MNVQTKSQLPSSPFQREPRTVGWMDWTGYKTLPCGQSTPGVASCPDARQESGGTALTEPVSLNLSGGRLGKRGNEVEPPRLLVRRDAVPDEFLQFLYELLRRVLRILQDNVCLWFHELFRVLLTHHGGLENRFVRDERILHFDGRDPDATNFQHVVASTAVPEVAVLVLVVFVTCLDPRPEERLLRLLVAIPIVRHRRVPLDAKIPHLPAWHGPTFLIDDEGLISWDRRAGGSRLHIPRTI